MINFKNSIQSSQLTLKTVWCQFCWFTVVFSLFLWKVNGFATQINFLSPPKPTVLIEWNGPLTILKWGYFEQRWNTLEVLLDSWTESMFTIGFWSFSTSHLIPHIRAWIPILQMPTVVALGNYECNFSVGLGAVKPWNFIHSQGLGNVWNQFFPRAWRLL